MSPGRPLNRLSRRGNRPPSRRRRLAAVTAAAAVGLLLLLGGTASGYGPTATDTWVVSGGSLGGVVASVAVKDSTAYLGGNFSFVGPETGSFVAADTASSALASPWPMVGGNVYAAAADGTGGFYIGGKFQSIGTRHADNVAHIKSDGTFDTAWNASTDGVVYALAVSGSTVFAGGAFANAGGSPRANLAAFDKTNGALVTGFDPGATGTSAVVWALRLSGSTLYVGGRFTLLGSAAHTNLGAVSTSGAVQPWSPSTDSTVFALAVGAGGTVYAGGSFLKVNGNNSRNYAAAFNPSGAVQNWAPDGDGPVYALEVSGSIVYAGGSFGFIGVQPRNSLAALSADPAGDGDAIASWNPDVHGQVFAITVGAPGSTVYVGGDFDKVNGTVSRDNVAALDPSTANATSFWTVVGGDVEALALSGTNVGLGGKFRSAGGGFGPTAAPLHRANLAAIDLSTGLATGWNPQANATVEVLQISGSIVYAGGAFTSITAANGTKPRERLVAFATSPPGNATNWNPGVHDANPADNVVDEVFALAVAGSTVYAGGNFTSVSTPPVTQNRLAAFEADGVGNGLGNLTSWNPNANGSVFALDVVGSAIVIGGSFTTMGGTARTRLAAVGTNGSLGAWSPGVNGSVLALTHVGTTEYAGGTFDTVTTVNGSTARNGVAAFATAGSGAVTSWNPQLLFSPGVSGDVYSLVPSASTMYMSGVFRTVGGLDSPSLAAVSLATGAPNVTWQPAVDETPNWIALAPQGLVVGGFFTAFGYPPPGSAYQPDENAAAYRGGFGLVRALPDAPVNVTATAGAGSATVTFDAPAYNGGAPITSYTLTPSSGGSPMSNVTSPVTVNGLTNGTAVTFSVTATTSAGIGEPGVSNTVTPRTVPGAPGSVTAVPADGRAVVSFTAPPDGGDPITQYTVHASTGQSATGTASPITIYGLANDTPVTFTVTATNSVGEGPASAASAPVTPVEGGRPHPTPPGPTSRPAVPDLPPILPPRIPPPGH